MKFYGHGKKTILEDVICFQQAATTYLQYYKAHNMHNPRVNKELNLKGDAELSKIEARLLKYLDRMYEIVNCKEKEHIKMAEDAIFKEIDKVI